MKFYIVTPTFNSLTWLPACIRSVMDQAIQGVEVHHHVQDGGSVDGTSSWLEDWKQRHANVPDYTFSYVSERDEGMYDAINLAWSKLPDDAAFTAHLNSDEQYLPGTLAKLLDCFAIYPRAEVLLGSYLILDADMHYICHRRPVVPKVWSSHFNCTCITNSAFYRASAFRGRKMAYDTRWKSIGDLVFFRDLLVENVRFYTIPLMTSSFVCTGGNLAWSGLSFEEWSTLKSETRGLPFFLYTRLPFKWVNFKRLVADFLLPAPRDYSVYFADEDSRRCFKILLPTARWGHRHHALEGAVRELD